MPKLTIDGKEIEVEAGTNLIEAARRLGIEVPHYCYHPGLSIAGQCRLCMVDIERNPRSQIACNTTAADGMVVHTETERVKDTRRSIMEFHLINHPLDCPVCDQAGECWLQIYYMKHGLYDPRMVDEKVHKPKAVPLGPHVMLDAERCILCSRCVRFCDEITGGGELGIFHRGDHSEIGLFPGQDLTNRYSANVVDICPVGALTDRDFRFQVRVWYLETAKSICPGCARGCNIEVHVNRQRPHHAEGRRVARLKPRLNPDVNAWWICDEGRYGFTSVDDPSRLTVPLSRQGALTADASWDDAVAALAEALGRTPPGEVGVLASPTMANEDLLALRRLCDARGITRVAFAVPPRTPSAGDDFLLRADRSPNARGAELIGFGGDAANVLAAARAGQLRCLLVFQHDLFQAGWPESDVRDALTRTETVVFAGTNANATSALARWVLPSAAWVERDGTFTNFEGRVQRFRQACEPLGAARPDWEWLGRLIAALGGASAGERAEHWFRALAESVPAFAGMSYRTLGDAGDSSRARGRRARPCHRAGAEHPCRHEPVSVALDLGIAFGRVAFAILFVVNLSALLGWVERKQSAIMQDRIGANRASIFGFRALGLFHPLADAIKMLTKEDFLPARADRLLFQLAPFVSVFFGLVAFASVPFGDTLRIGDREIPLQAVTLNVGILYLFAMLSLGVYGVMMAGWSSANNYALLGAQRAAALMISAEIAIGASIMGVIMVYGSLDLQGIVRAQGQLLWGWLPAWGVVLQPLAFVLFLTAGIAATKRIPFDMPEGESEIIGYFVEYSGMKFGMFLMADMVETIVIAGMTTSLFLGGWQVPWLGPDGFRFPWGAALELPHLLVVLLQVGAFHVKIGAMIFLMMLIRWTLPRFRYDQAMRLGWLGLFPLSILNIVVTGGLLLLGGMAAAR